MRRIGIACISSSKAIGSKNDLLYRIPSELSLFKKITSLRTTDRKSNMIVMGRKTFESLNNQPLPNRLNCIVSSNHEKLSDQFKHDDLKFFPSVEETLDYYNSSLHRFSNLFICGGSSIYKYCIENNLLDYLILTHIKNHEYNEGDTFFPDYENKFFKISSNNHYYKPATINKCGSKVNLDYACNVYANKLTYNDASLDFVIKDIIDITKSDENNTVMPIITNLVDTTYTNALKDVLRSGNYRKTRNSNTISKFGVNMEFDISNRLPLLTTKRVYWSGIIKELLWFIKGDTNANNLNNDKVKIWNGNSSRKFLDSINLNHYKEGDCGPIYGFQWRHFNAPYVGFNACYDNLGVDQLQNVIDLIKNDPFSRRIIMSGWNPEQLNEMCLPPCHVLYQFYVNMDSSGNKLLSCSMYQRSGDMFLGIPFNIASTATLTYIIAHITNCKPDKIILNIGDAHIYENHIEAIQTQLERSHKELPTLKILGEPKENINDYTINDFVLENYRPYGNIKADMVA